MEFFGECCFDFAHSFESGDFSETCGVDAVLGGEDDGDKNDDRGDDGDDG